MMALRGLVGMSIALILTELMAREQLSDNDLAARTGVPQPTISRIKSGESRDPRDSTLRPLAEYFRISISQLRGDAPLPSAYVEVAANDQIVRVSSESMRLLLALDALSPKDRAALQTLVDSLAQSKGVNEDGNQTDCG